MPISDSSKKSSLHLRFIILPVRKTTIFECANLRNRKGLKISEYGVENEDGSITTFESEEQFFAHFDLPFIPPALRRNGSEIDRIEELQDSLHFRTFARTYICTHMV